MWVGCGGDKIIRPRVGPAAVVAGHLLSADLLVISIHIRAKSSKGRA